MVNIAFKSKLLSSDNYTDLWLAESTIDGKSYVHELEFQVTPSGRFPGEATFDDGTWDKLSRLPTKCTISYVDEGKESKYLIWRIDFKRKKAWLRKV